jgi:hypothetical protein
MARIELVFFSGCPNVEAARLNLRAACAALGLPPSWTEWDLLEDGVPTRMHTLGSPTVLLDGKDITGVAPAGALACRSAGAPSVEQITAALGGRV